MNNEPRERVLRMVASGTVTPEEGADLLSALEPADRPSRSMDWSAPMHESPRPKSLVIRIEENGNARVNIRIPLTLARGAGKFFPRNVHQHLESHYDIHLSDVLADIGTGASAGPLLDIQDAADRVYIAVE